MFEENNWSQVTQFFVKINSKRWELYLYLWKVKKCSPNGTGENPCVICVILADADVIKIAFYIRRMGTTTAKHEKHMSACCLTRNDKWFSGCETERK